MGKLNDITGMMFGNWKVLERIDDYISPSGYRKTQYLCECQCSERTIKPQLAANLIKHKTLSCGCLKENNIHYQWYNNGIKPLLYIKIISRLFLHISTNN